MFRNLVLTCFFVFSVEAFACSIKNPDGSFIGAKIVGKAMYIERSSGQFARVFEEGTAHEVGCQFSREPFGRKNLYFVYETNKTLKISLVDGETTEVVWTKDLGSEKIGQSYFYPKVLFYNSPDDTSTHGINWEFLQVRSVHTQPDGCYGVPTDADCIVRFALMTGDLKTVTAVPKHSQISNAKVVDFRMYRNPVTGHDTSRDVAKYMFKSVDATQCSFEDQLSVSCSQAVGFSFLEPFRASDSFCLFDFGTYDVSTVTDFGFYAAHSEGFVLKNPSAPWPFYASCKKP